MSRAYREAQEILGKDATKREILEAISPQYEPGHGRTKQSFKDSCDINKILEKATQTGSLAHVVKHGARYEDFANLPQDLLASYQQRDAAFNDLPAEIKREFNQDPADFFRWAAKFQNESDLVSAMKELAPGGDQRVPNVLRSGDNMRAEPASAPQSASMVPPSPDTGGGDSEPQEGSGEGS